MEDPKWIREYLEGEDWGKPGATYCPKCGGFGSVPYRFCPWCGEKLTGDEVVFVKCKGDMFDYSMFEKYADKEGVNAN